MKKTLRIAAGITLAGIVLYYPAMRLYEFVAGKIANRKKQMEEEGEGETHVKAFVPAWRGKHKPHHRHPHQDNGHTDPSNS